MDCGNQFINNVTEKLVNPRTATALALLLPFAASSVCLKKKYTIEGSSFQIASFP